MSGTAEPASEGQGRRSRLDEFIANPRRAMWTVAGPMMIGFAVHAVYGVVDAAFIGRLGAEALAAATYVGPLFMIAIALTNGVATGITAVLAQAIGRRDSEAADHVASNGLGLALVLGLFLTAAGLLAGQSLVPLLGAEGKTAELTWQYFLPICAAMPLFFFSSAIRAVLNGEGNARTPMIILSMATLINLVCDPIFIFSLGLGIRGAALATVLAQLFALTAFIYVVLIRHRTFSRFRLSLIPPTARLILPMLSIGLPAAGSILVMGAGMALTNRVLAEFGQVAVAGYGAGTKVDMIVALPVLGLASAAITVVGMFHGAGHHELVRFTALYTYRWAITAALVLGISAFLASRPVIGLFVSDPYALEVGRVYLCFMVFAYPMMAVGMTSGRVLQGVGKGVPAFLITLLRVLVVGLPAAYVAVYLFDAPIHAVWICLICGGIVSNVVAVLWVRRQVW